MNIKCNLKTLLKDRNMTQAELAEKLGVKRQVVGNWVTGSNFPNPQHMLKVCVILDCRISDFILIEQKTS